MGAWDPSTFRNDDAADWARGVVESDSDSMVRDTLRQVAAWEPAHYLEADLGAAALVAAELLAAAAGTPASPTPANQEALAWAATQPQLAELAPLAIGAIGRVRAPDSELRELWADAGPLAMAEWTSIMDELLKRLT
ncbi:DUF4259 domain-containing protein [Kribbella sp. NPDC055071]